MPEDEFYLSRLILRARSKHVQRDLQNCQRLHCRVMSAFPDTDSEKPRERYGVLYRIDWSQRKRELKLLVQSSIKPSWAKLPPDYLLLPAQTNEQNSAWRRIDQEYAGLREGTGLRFRLRANPTRRVSSRCEAEKSEAHGKRVEINEKQKQIEWLERKGTQSGFGLVNIGPKHGRVVPRIHVTPEAKVLGWRSAKGCFKDDEFQVTAPRRPPDMKFGSVLFEGVFRITSTEDFRKALTNGIGSGKAYGFGLLSIAPAR